MLFFALRSNRPLAASATLFHTFSKGQPGEAMKAGLALGMTVWLIAAAATAPRAGLAQESPQSQI